MHLEKINGTLVLFFVVFFCFRLNGQNDSRLQDY